MADAFRDASLKKIYYSPPVASRKISTVPGLLGVDALSPRACA
jgi:hypothetical protein